MHEGNHRTDNGDAPGHGSRLRSREPDAHEALRRGDRSPEVVRLAEAMLPTRFGRFRIGVCQAGEPSEVVVLRRGTLGDATPSLLQTKARRMGHALSPDGPGKQRGTSCLHGGELAGWHRR